jgi:hypothetical protein
MKKKATSLFIIMLVLFMQNQLLAHPPSAIKLAYNKGSLNIIILHGSLAPKAHFIKKVEISLNGNSLLNKVFTEQTDSKQLVFDYPTTLKKGDILQVKGVCNLFGSKTTTYTIP